MNPINASNQTFGCKGLTTIEHLLTYWVSPLAAAVIVPCIFYYVTTETTLHGKLNGNVCSNGNGSDNAVHFEGRDKPAVENNNQYMLRSKSANTNTVRRVNMKSHIDNKFDDRIR